MHKKIKLLYFTGAIVYCIAGCSITNDSSLQPQTAHKNIQLGLGYLQEGETERAKQKLLLALQQDPNASEAQIAMGYFLAHEGNPKDAEFYYKKAFQLDPHSGQVQMNYGVFLCEQGLYQKGLSLLTAAFQNRQYLHHQEALDNIASCKLKNNLSINQLNSTSQ